MAGIRQKWRDLETKQKTFAVATTSLLLLTIGYVGIGYVIASQAIAVNPGCGMWSENTPSDWSTDDDWESFEPCPMADERVESRRDFDAST